MDNDFAMGYAMGADNNGGGGGNGGFSIGGVGDLAALLVVAGIFGGGGWGFGGFGGGGGMGMMLNGIATRADINEGFALQNITGGIQGISNGLCDGFHNQTVALMNGFNNMQSSINGIGHQISDCCCATQNAIQNVRFDLSKGLCDLGNAINMQTRDIIDNQNANYRSMYDFLVSEKLSAKDARITEQANIISQMNQTSLFNAKVDSAVAELIRRTGHDYPTASYLVQPPTAINFPTNGCGQVQFNGGNGGYGGCCWGNAA